MSNASPPGNVIVSQNWSLSGMGRANDLDPHLTADRGSLAIGADRNHYRARQPPFLPDRQQIAKRHAVPSPTHRKLLILLSCAVVPSSAQYLRQASSNCERR
jgi:hypothetical protein